MRKSSPIKLSIPTPCSQNWEGMSVTETGRFCDSCNKSVIDFTAYSDQQLADFFKRSKGGVCGKFKNDQLEKPLESLQYSQNRSLPQFMISAALTIGLGNNVHAAEKQITPTAIHAVTSGEKKESTSTPGGGDTHCISGKIIDKNTKEELPWVAVQIEGSEIGIGSDIHGLFKLMVPQRFLSDTVKLVVSCYGYTSKMLNISAGDFPFHTIVELEKSAINQSEIVVTASAISRTSKSMGYTTVEKAPDENKTNVTKTLTFWQRFKHWFRIKRK
jgi:hypothetical protein